jgi:hypothetical protein
MVWPVCVFRPLPDAFTSLVGVGYTKRRRIDETPYVAVGGDGGRNHGPRRRGALAATDHRVKA